MKKGFVAPAIRVEASLSRLTLGDCVSCTVIDGGVQDQ